MSLATCEQPTGTAAPEPRSFADQLLGAGRFALLLRPQLARELSDELLTRAHAALTRKMAFTPAGPVCVQPWEPGHPEIEPQTAPRQLEIARFFLDRDPVTNREFQQFVLGGGYEQEALWQPEGWSQIEAYVDRSGVAGPSHWEHQRFPTDKSEHPVVGISWFEAAAYANWVGKRLPSEAEWVRAAAWPVSPDGAGRPVQRRFPWGDTLDSARANLWASGVGDTVPVDRYPKGLSVNGVRQLAGNVWEWTTGRHPGGSELRAVRGGAFNTYFENQATTDFQSGEYQHARRHNVGFRCALGSCDVVAMRNPISVERTS